MQPTHRQSYGRTHRRRAHDALKARQTVLCPSCGETKLPHRACSACGYVRPGLQLQTQGEEE